jgi:hypothetical protein
MVLGRRACDASRDRTVHHDVAGGEQEVASDGAGRVDRQRASGSGDVLGHVA